MYSHMLQQRSKHEKVSSSEPVSKDRKVKSK